MKKLICGLLAASMLGSTAVAEVVIKNGAYVLQPGVYKVGEDLPAGHYDVRFKDFNVGCNFTFSDQLTDDGHPDLTSYYSYYFSYISAKWWQAVHPIILLTNYGYIEVLQSPCYLYPEK